MIPTMTDHKPDSNITNQYTNQFICSGNCNWIIHCSFSTVSIIHRM